MLQCRLQGLFLWCLLKVQTSGIQLMKIACKRLNWPKNTLLVDDTSNVRGSPSIIFEYH